LIDQFVLVLNKFAALEKSPRDFGTGGKLFPSEIHTVNAIGRHPGMNMTDLASALGISKPAVTQIIAKVIKKNLVERYNGEGNRKEVLLRLTKSGRVAHRGHQEFHALMDADIINRLEKLTSREQDFLSGLFGDMALYFDRAIKERTPEVSSDQPSERKRGKR
jgi:DNA-binding MarR family transcriptional regulator